MDKLKSISFLLILIVTGYININGVTAEEFYRIVNEGLDLCNSKSYFEGAYRIKDLYPLIENDLNKELNYYRGLCYCYLGACSNSLLINKSVDCSSTIDLCLKSKEIIEKATKIDECEYGEILGLISKSYFKLLSNSDQADYYSGLGLNISSRCLDKNKILSSLVNRNIILITKGNYEQAGEIIDAIEELCDSIACQEEIKNETAHWKNLVNNLIEKDKKIELTEVWDIYGINTSYYHIEISVIVQNQFDFDYDMSLLDWSYDFFSNITNLRYDAPTAGIVSPVTIAHDKDTLIEGFYFIPELGQKLRSGEQKVIKISFDHPRHNITYLASRASALIKGLNIRYRKIVNIYSNDEIFSEYAAERWIAEDHYVMIWEKNISGTSPNSFHSNFHVVGAYFPFIDSPNSFGTIFGLAKPTFKRNWLKEDINIEKIANNEAIGKIQHNERMDFLNPGNLKYISTRLFFIGEATRDILVEPIKGIEIKKPIQAKLNEYNPEYGENQAYISNKEGNTRYLFFFVNTSGRDIELSLTYPINFSSHLSQIDKYNYRLEYRVIFYPGEFPLFDRQYRFTLPENYEIISASPKAQINKNMITFHLEEDFRLKDTISFNFKDVAKLKAKEERNTRMIQSLFIIQTIIFGVVMFLIHLNYRRSRIFLSFLIILLPLLLIISTNPVGNFPILKSIHYLIPAMILFLVYSLILLYFYKEAKKAGNIKNNDKSE